MECDLKDITVHYEVFGEGRPLLVLHGWGMDHRYMVSDLEPLFEQRDGWQRIYPDLPGHGMTPGPEWIKDRDQELDVVLDFVDAVIPENASRWRARRPELTWPAVWSIAARRRSTACF